MNKDYENHILNECEYKVHLCGKCGFETSGTKRMPHNCFLIAKSFLSDLKFKYFLVQSKLIAVNWFRRSKQQIL